MNRIVKISIETCDVTNTYPDNSLHVPVYGIIIPFAAKNPNEQVITSWISDISLPRVANDDTDTKDLLSRPEVSLKVIYMHI